MYKITMTTKLESEDGVMCEQTTVWSNMGYASMLGLETSYADWLASLPRTIGAHPSSSGSTDNS